jgi:uncharacterized SAM-binding protein YcdF (DUF218 family)
MSSVAYAAYKIVKVLVYPLTWIVLLVALALLWAGGRHAHRARVCLVLALAVAYGLSIPPVSRTLAWTLERRYPVPADAAVAAGAPFDAVVVLAGGVARAGGLRPRDRPEPLTLERLVCGRELMVRGASSTIVLSGGSGEPFGEHAPEGPIMAHTLRSLGSARWSIRTEAHSRTTYENAVETSKLLGARTRIALVTSALHMPRAMAVFSRQGFHATPFPCGFLAGPPVPGVMEYVPDVVALKESTSAINEWVGLALYRLAGKAD